MKLFKFPQALILACMLSVSIVAGQAPPTDKSPTEASPDAPPDEAASVVKPAAVPATPTPAPIPTVPAQPKSGHFEITDEVIQKSPLRFGVDVDLPKFRPWTGWIPMNQYVVNQSFEPVSYRYQGFATGGSETTLIDNAGSTLAWYNSFQGNWWAGADYVVFHPKPEGGFSVLRKGKVKSSDVGKDHPNSTEFESAGPAVTAGDFYQLSFLNATVPPMRQSSYKHFSMTPGTEEETKQGAKWVIFKEKEGDAAAPPAELSYDTAHVPEGGGKSSLRVKLPTAGNIGVSDFWFGGTDGKGHEGWTVPPTGATEMSIRFSARQEGLASAKMKVYVGDWSQEIEVGSDWKTYEFKFPVGDKFKVGNSYRFVAQGPGTFWLDKLSIWDPRFLENSITPWIVDDLKKNHPSTIRIWTAAGVGMGGENFDNAIAGPYERESKLHVDSAIGASAAASLPQMLALCKEVGAEPWIIICPGYTPEELHHMMEYLGGPATSPYGAKRAKGGQEQPWTSVFSHIYIEYGNEQWNPPYRPMAFGFDKGDLSGRLDGYLSDQIKADPNYSADKYKLIMSGTPNTVGHFSEMALDGAQDKEDMMDMAAYLGGGADSPDVVAQGDDAIYQARLDYFFRISQPGLEAEMALISKHNKTAAIYEFGPGYDLPGPHNPAKPEDELHGKSIAQAISTLDAAMFGQEHNIGPICFFTFKPGTRWATHSAMPDLNPQTAWEVLTMRNNFCSGDLVNVKVIDQPTIDLPESFTSNTKKDGTVVKRKRAAVTGVPGIKVYAYKDGSKYSVVMYSRLLKEPTDVTLKFPFTPQKKGTVHILTAASPAAGNIEKLEVPIKTYDVSDLQAEYKIKLPPFSAIILETSK